MYLSHTHTHASNSRSNSLQHRKCLHQAFLYFNWKKFPISRFMGRLCASHECVPKSYNIMDAVCSIYLIFFAIALSAACFSWCMAGYGHFTNYSHKSIYCPSTSIFPKHKQSFQTRNTFAWLVLRSGVIKAHRIQIKQSK